MRIFRVIAFFFRNVYCLRIYTMSVCGRVYLWLGGAGQLYLEFKGPFVVCWTRSISLQSPHVENNACCVYNFYCIKTFFLHVSLSFFFLFWKVLVDRASKRGYRVEAISGFGLTLYKHWCSQFVCTFLIDNIFSWVESAYYCLLLDRSSSNEKNVFFYVLTK